MEKKITYKGKEYTLEIKWAGGSYAARIVGFDGWRVISKDFFTDIESLKSFVISMIGYNGDLKIVEDWDGNLDKTTGEILKQDAWKNQERGCCMGCKNWRATAHGSGNCSVLSIYTDEGFDCKKWTRVH